MRHPHHESATTTGRALLTVLLRLVAVGWALVMCTGLLLLIPAGYLVGLITWAQDGIAAAYLLVQLALATVAAITAARRPLVATTALAAIGLLLGGGQALFLRGIAGHSADPLAWQHKAWHYVLPSAVCTVALALILPLLGWYLHRRGTAGAARWPGRRLVRAAMGGHRSS